jgi:hypothetical protein
METTTLTDTTQTTILTATTEATTGKDTIETTTLTYTTEAATVKDTTETTVVIDATACACFFLLCIQAKIIQQNKDVKMMTESATNIHQGQYKSCIFSQKLESIDVDVELPKAKHTFY